MSSGNGSTRHWSAERCARLLEQAKRYKSGWSACCPAHDDANPSLFLADADDGGLVLRCHASCSFQEVANALEAKGAVVFNHAHDDVGTVPDRHYQLGEYHSYWDYYDAAGRHTARVCRWETVEGRKEIRPIIKTAEGWKWAHHPNPRPLFQLDRLTREAGKPVLVVEGEKAASAAQRLFPGHIVTTWMGGASSTSNTDLSPLHGREVILIPDCDVPGRKAMDALRAALRGKAASVRIVDPSRIDPTLPEKWDLADALTEGRDVSKWLDATSECESAAQPEASAKPAPEFVWLGDVTVETTDDHQVEDLVMKDSLVVDFGDSNVGKSTLKLDMLLSVAHGLKFRGLVTRQGLVVYLAGEGVRGVKHRATAWMREHPDLVAGPFAIWPNAVNFRNLASVAALIDRIKAAEQKVGCKCAAVAVDTLMRCLYGSDNDPEHMGEFLTACDMLRHEFGCAVHIVHHSGKDSSRGARGHSMLRAAVDTEIEVTGDRDLRFATVTKQRDILTIPPMGFELRPVVIGVNDRGRSITATVVDHKDVSAPRKLPSGKRQRQLLDLLQIKAKAGVATWPTAEIVGLARKELEMGKSTAYDCVLGLTNAGFLKQTIGGLGLTA